MNKYLRWGLFLTLAAIYIALAYKNPYSTRTLVPNLEPYPDTLYYSNPAYNTVQGKGFVMEAFGYQNKLITPPVYSLYLIPFFAAFGDVRAFYFANMLLMIGSVWLFLHIAKKLFHDTTPVDIVITAFVGFLFVTNFYLYILPSLLMAENVTLFLSMCALYLLVSPTNRTKSFFAGLLGIILTMVKFSNVGLTGAFYILYGYKLFIDTPDKKIRKTFAITLCFSLVLFFFYISTSQIFVGHKNLSPGVGFSISYFLTNFWSYLQTLGGGQERFLWFTHRMLSPVLMIPMSLGILIGLRSTQWRQYSLSLITYMLSVTMFMSFFYTRDIRYILAVYPAMLLFVGIGFLYIKKQFGHRVALAGIMLVGLVYLFIPQAGQVVGERHLITLKKQVGLNFRHAEEPWNYNAVIEFNTYFSQKTSRRPYLGTLLPPYFVAYFANNNYNYLPISMGQEFFGDKKNPPGIYLKSLSDYYRQLLEGGAEIYVSPYYQANLSSWKTDYENLVSNFDIEFVHTGCHETCNIYRLTLSPNTNPPLKRAGDATPRRQGFAGQAGWDACPSEASCEGGRERQNLLKLSFKINL